MKASDEMTEYYDTTQSLIATLDRKFQEQAAYTNEKLDALRDDVEDIQDKLDEILKVLAFGDPLKPQTTDNRPQPQTNKSKCKHLWALPENDTITCELCGHVFKVEDMKSMVFCNIVKAARNRRAPEFAQEFERRMKESASRVGLKIPEIIK